MEDFPYKGDPAGLVLSRLGLPQDTLIKIRRRLSPGILRQMSQSLENNATLRFPGSTHYSTLGKESTAHHHQQQEPHVNAIFEASQRTFKAETLYSYRMRAESLWGTTDDFTQEEGKGLSPTHVAAFDATASGVASVGSSSRKFWRKRWASDADDVAATPSAGQKSQSLGAAAAAADASRRNGDKVEAESNGNGNGGGDGGPQSGGLVEGETYTDIFPVSASEPIQAGDVLFMSCPQENMIDFQAVTVSQGLKGLKFLDVSALDLPGHGTEFFEIVLSGHNHFVGRSASRDNAEFAAYYNVSVVAVRRRGQATATNPTAAIPAAPPPPPPPPHQPRETTTGGAPDARLEDAPEVCLEEGVDPELNPFGSGVSPSGSASAHYRQPGAHHATAGGSSVGAFGSSRPLSRGRGAAWGLPRSPGRSRMGSHAVEDDKDKDVTASSFKAGDVVLVLAKEEFMEKYGSSRDFFLVTKVGSVPKPVRYFDYLPLVAFLGMLVWVLFDVEMVSFEAHTM